MKHIHEYVCIIWNENKLWKLKPQMNKFDEFHSASLEVD